MILLTFVWVGSILPASILAIRDWETPASLASSDWVMPYFFRISLIVESSGSISRGILMSSIYSFWDSARMMSLLTPGRATFLYTLPKKALALLLGQEEVEYDDREGNRKEQGLALCGVSDCRRIFVLLPWSAEASWVVWRHSYVG